MKARIENHKVHLDLTELVDGMSPEDKRLLARKLCADQYLIQAALEIAADDSASGYGHYFSDEDDGPWWFCSRTTLEIREKLLPLMPVVARQAVLEALRQRDAAIADCKRHSDWAWKMYHAWPRGSDWSSQPRLPDWVLPPKGDIETEADELLGATDAKVGQ